MPADPVVLTPAVEVRLEAWMERRRARRARLAGEAERVELAPGCGPRQLLGEGVCEQPLLPQTPVISEEMAERHRHFGCPSYDACLGRAADREWVSFTCRDCAAAGPLLARFP